MIAGYTPLRRAWKLDHLDSDEMVAGYLAGFEGTPCPQDASFSYWHGWRNGMVDGKHAEGDEAQSELAQNLAQMRRA